MNTITILAAPLRAELVWGTPTEEIMAASAFVLAVAVTAAARALLRAWRRRHALDIVYESIAPKAV